MDMTTLSLLRMPLMEKSLENETISLIYLIIGLPSTYFVAFIAFYVLFGSVTVWGQLLQNYDYRNLFKDSHNSTKYFFKLPRWNWNHIRHVLFQGPMYTIRFPLCVILSLRDVYTSRRATEEDVIRFVCETSLCIMVKRIRNFDNHPNPDIGNTESSRNFPKNKFELNYEGCQVVKLTKYGKFEISSMRMIFSVEPFQVEKFEFNGKLVENSEEMYSIVTIFLFAGTHPKIHFNGERSVENILQTGISTSS